MRNVNVLVKPQETIGDIIAQICTIEKLRPDEHFAFSAIMTRDAQEGYRQLKINCLPEDNPHTPQSLITTLFDQTDRNPQYVTPPLEQFLTVFRPMLYKMVNKAHPYYQKLIPDKEDMLSILFLSVVELHNKDYYLHNTLIYKAFINNLNKEIRKIKSFQDIKSLDEPLSSEDGEGSSLIDLIQDPEAHLFTEQSDEDYRRELFETIKAAMLKDMSQLSFDRILIQLKSQTIDTPTSRILSKYRTMFNPDFIPRPNARSENGGTKPRRRS